MHKQGVNADGEFLRDFYVEHDPVAVPTADDGLTRQEFADECDINVLMARYERTGVLNHFSARQPEYFDAGEVPDLASALHLMEDARRAFMSLPAVIRREFDNDPVRFVEFAGDPANLSKMREWGLAPPAPVEPVVEVPAPKAP